MEGHVTKDLLESVKLLSEELGHPREHVDVVHHHRGKHEAVRRHGVRAFGNLRHPEPRGIEVAAEEAFEGRHHPRIADHGHAERASHALDGDIVVGRPHPPRREHDIEATAELDDFGRDLFDFVGDHDDTPHVHPERAKLAAEVHGVRVRHLAGEKLVADEDDARRPTHGRPHGST